VNQQDKKGNTPLHYAVVYREKNKDILPCLLADPRIDLSIKNKQHKTASDLAGYNLELSSLLEENNRTDLDVDSVTGTRARDQVSDDEREESIEEGVSNIHKRRKLNMCSPVQSSSYSRETFTPISNHSRAVSPDSSLASSAPSSPHSIPHASTQAWVSSCFLLPIDELQVYTNQNGIIGDEPEVELSDDIMDHVSFRSVSSDSLVSLDEFRCSPALEVSTASSEPRHEELGLSIHEAISQLTGPEWDAGIKALKARFDALETIVL
jgi:hypothetical protein